MEGEFSKLATRILHNAREVKEDWYLLKGEELTDLIHEIYLAVYQKFISVPNEN